MNWEEWLGLKFTAFIAGIVGGVISLTFETKLSFLRALALILVGGSVAGYSYKFAEVYFNINPQLMGIFGFTVGLIGMRMVNTLIIIADMIQRDPVILLSIPKFYQGLKNGRFTDITNTNRSGSISIPDIHSPREDSIEGGSDPKRTNSNISS